MTKPWMRVTPPTHGQGYYPWEGWPARSFREPPLTTDIPGALRAISAIKPSLPRGISGKDFIRDELDRPQNLIAEAVEQGATEQLIEALRAKGYSVTPPTPTEGNES